MAATLQILATKSLKKTPDVFLALLHTYTHIHTHTSARNFQSYAIFKSHDALVHIHALRLIFNQVLIKLLL